jgi:serine O-acetyltransferase
MKRSHSKREKTVKDKYDSSWQDCIPDHMLEIIKREQDTADNDWVEEGLPKLVDEIIDNYEREGGIGHLEGRDLPSSQVVTDVLEDLMAILFPGYMSKIEITRSNVQYTIGKTLDSIYIRLVDEVEKSLKYVCRRIKSCPEDICLRISKVVVKELLQKIPEIRALLRGDIQAAFDGDPAAQSTDEVILSYPCVLAIATYRISHELYARSVPLVPRIMSEYAHSKTGIDIHPGARIGKNFFIDHGTGVVIGETTEIGDNVKIYQGVTLGALSFPKDEDGSVVRGKKRHPTVGNNVVIYSGATLLGGETGVGDDSVVGGNVWITSSIPSDTQVTIIPPEHRYKNINMG